MPTPHPDYRTDPLYASHRALYFLVRADLAAENGKPGGYRHVTLDNAGTALCELEQYHPGHLHLEPLTQYFLDLVTAYVGRRPRS